MLLIENLYSDIEVQPSKEYLLELREVNSKRTLQQNKLLWILIHKIAEHNTIQQTEIEIYTAALEEANAKYIYLLGVPEAEDELRQHFRAVKIVRPTIENGKEYLVYKCFIGSSKMNTKEMAKLLEIIMKWAEELGIDTDAEHYAEY